MEKQIKSAKAVQKIREDEGMVQKQFADYVGISLSLLQALEQGERKLTGDVAGKIYVVTGQNPGWTASQVKAFNCGKRDICKGEAMNSSPSECCRYFANLLELLFAAAKKADPRRMEQVGRQLSCDFHNIARQFGLLPEINRERFKRNSVNGMHPFYGSFIEDIDKEWEWLFHQTEPGVVKASEQPSASSLGKSKETRSGS